MARNAEKFISLFNEIEHVLRDLDGGDRYVPFYKLVDQVSYKNKVVSRYASGLKMYADLRNVIVHNQIDNRFIADPDDAAIAELGDMLLKIQSPILALSVVRHQVQCVLMNDPLPNVLAFMKVQGYSQLPVYENEVFMGVINAHVLSLWLTNKMTDSGQLPDRLASVKDIMAYKTEKGKTLFLPRTVSAIEVLDQYQEFAKRADMIDAIIITHSGKTDEAPLTIITDYDIPILLGCL